MCFLLFYADINFSRLFWESTITTVVRARTDLVGWITIWYIEGIHGPNHGLHSHEDILVHDFDEATPIRIRVSGSMDNSHLLDEGAFATFSSSCNYSR